MQCDNWTVCLSSMALPGPTSSKSQLVGTEWSLSNRSSFSLVSEGFSPLNLPSV